MLNENRYKIRPLRGKDIELSVNLSFGNMEPIDFKESHDNLLTDEKNNNINSILDGEVVRFKSLSPNNTTLTFLFSGSSNYLNGGFSYEDIINGEDAFLNSNYFYQVFDTIDNANQNILHTGYINGYQILSTGTTSVHNILRSAESFNIYLPEYFLETLSENIFSLYLRFYFYNAKSGKIVPFTQNTTSLTSESLLYFPLTFNKLNRTHDFAAFMTLRELPSSQYTTIVNNKGESITIEKINYPNATSFSIDGIYS